MNQPGMLAMTPGNLLLGARDAINARAIFFRTLSHAEAVKNTDKHRQL
jgi:hypothetical protein